jgi:hypothetical protein
VADNSTSIGGKEANRIMGLSGGPVNSTLLLVQVLRQLRNKAAELANRNKILPLLPIKLAYRTPINEEAC